MCADNHFYICKHCGNMIGLIHDSGVPVMCCGQPMTKLEADVEQPKVCELKPLDTASVENYVVCKCNNVTYFDILDEIHGQNDIGNLMDVFAAVKNTTHCSAGCGGCYDKVIAIISEAMSNK